MKFLYYTDSHHRTEKPRYRIDDVYSSQFQELGEIASLVLEHDCDFILHGGDFFDHPRPSHELVRDIISWGKYVGVPIYVLAGNHDLVGYNSESILSVGLGVLFESEVFKPLKELEFLEEKLFIKGVLPEVVPHNDKYVLPKDDSWTKIVVSHNYISPTPLLFPYLPTQEVKTNANLFLLGHLHEPSDVEINGTRFINPGAIARWSRDQANRIPTVLLIESVRGIIKVEKIPLSCAKPSAEIFDLNGAELVNKKEDQLAAFMESLTNTSFESVDIEQLVLSAGQNQGLDHQTLDKSLVTIREAKEILK